MCFKIPNRSKIIKKCHKRDYKIGEYFICLCLAEWCFKAQIQVRNGCPHPMVGTGFITFSCKDTSFEWRDACLLLSFPGRQYQIWDPVGWPAGPCDGSWIWPRIGGGGSLWGSDQPITHTICFSLPGFCHTESSQTHCHVGSSQSLALLGISIWLPDVPATSSHHSREVWGGKTASPSRQ